MRTCTLSFVIAGLLSVPFLARADEDALKQEIDALKAQNKLILERLDATAEMLESGGAPAAAGEAGGSHDHGISTTGSMRDRTFGIHGGSGSTTVGAYGEMHYNNLSNQKAGGSDKKEMDFHRFILFMGHEFSDKIRFWSELEVEHSVIKDTADGSNAGEVAIEQAFLEFDLNNDTAARAGIILVPVGLLNETHEPPTFYGVERNNVESKILPTTWREGGASLVGRFADSFSYDLAVHTGLQVSSSSDYAVRSGRMGVSEAPANDLAATARLNWVGMPGLVVGAAIQRQSDITQSTDSSAGSATLLSAHLVWQVSQFTLRSVYATWDLSGSGPASAGADEQTGWYVEPSWKFTPEFGVFARASQWDNRVNSGTDTQYDQIDVGFNYWPHENVVLKVDYQDQSAPNGEDEYDGINLGVGYQF
ncbi:MAG TPA: porin [Gammaproteobacteria bacterium]|nr:porin [Gammaproteobacteria bacterium]